MSGDVMRQCGVKGRVVMITLEWISPSVPITMVLKLSLFSLLIISHCFSVYISSSLVVNYTKNKSP